MRTAATMQRRPAYARSTNYSYYHAGYRGRQSVRAQKQSSGHRSRLMVGLVLFAVIGLGMFVGFRSANSSSGVKASEASISNTVPTVPKQSQAVAAPAPVTNECASNTLDKFIKVNTSSRHMWACEGTKLVYDAPVITGMDRYEETVTPPGTYKIYNKQTKQVLTGKDSAGSWNRPVKYWMPFLHNQHGVYGFHDADWRPASEFGTIDPSSDKGSHGCVELSDAAQHWLYNWAPVGTTLTIEN